MNFWKGLCLLQTVSCVFLTTGSPLAADTLYEALQETKINGQVRYFIMQRHYSELLQNSTVASEKKDDYRKSSSAAGGYLAIESGTFFHLTGKAALYTSQPVFYNAPDEGGLQLLKDNQHGYMLLGQAALKWEYSGTSITVGRQLLSEYRLLSDSDIRMTPYTYEAATLENRDIENVTLRFAGVYGVQKMADPSYVDFVEASRDLLVETTIDRNPIRGDYNHDHFDANNHYIGPRKNLFLGSAVYQDSSLNIELWDYYSSDFVNFLYVTGSWSSRIDNFDTLMEIQGVKQDDVGSHVAGSIDTYTYGLLLKGTWNDLSLQYAYSKVKYDEDSLDGGTIIDNWGNSMLYNSLTYNPGDRGGSTGNSLTLVYDLTSWNLNMSFTAARFDLPNRLTDIFADQDNSEYDLTLRYKPHWNKRFDFKVTAVYVDFDTDYDFKAYEDLHGFTFLHTYDEILDLRFVVNYSF